MLPDVVFEHWGASSQTQPAYLVYHRLLTNARLGTPLEGRVVMAQLGWGVEQFTHAASLVRAVGLLQPTRVVTIVGDAYIERAVRAAARGELHYDGRWWSPRAEVNHAEWVAERAVGSGQFGTQPFGYSRTLSEQEAWAVLEEERAYWRGWLEFPVVKKGRSYTPATDPLRPQVEAVQQYANRRFGKSVQLLDAQGKEVGRGSGLGRYGVIRRALAEWGYSVEQLQVVIDRAAEDEWWRSKGLLDTLRIFRKPEHAERWLDVGAGPRTLLSVGGRSDAEAF